MDGGKPGWTGVSLVDGGKPGWTGVSLDGRG